MEDPICHAKELKICFIGGQIQLEFCRRKDNSGVIVHVALRKGKIFQNDITAT